MLKAKTDEGIKNIRIEFDPEKECESGACDGDTYEEVVVPMLFAGSKIKVDYEFNTCMNIDLLPTVLKWLEIEWRGSTIEGKPIDEIFE